MPSLIEVEGHRQTRRAIAKLTEAKPERKILREAAKNAEDVAARTLDSLIASNSITHRVKGMEARVFSQMSDTRTLSIEEGRRRGGDLIYTKQLKPWAKRVGFRGSLFDLAKRIRRFGTEGKFFMRAADEDTRAKIPGWAKDASKSIEAVFRKEAKRGR